MELKKYKKIKNTKKLPGYYDGKSEVQLTPEQMRAIYWKGVGNNFINNFGNIATSGLSAFNAINNAFSYNKSADDMLNEAGTTNSNIRGIGFTQQSYVDSQKQMDELNAQNKSNTMNAATSGATTGAAVGSIFGPVGGAIGGAIGGLGGLIGGLFGSSKRKREMRRRMLEANKNALRNNNNAASIAGSKAMQMDYEQEHGDSRNSILYAYDKGKDKTITPYGKTSDEPNSRVSVGEPVLDGLDDTSNASGYVPKTGKPHADDQLANLSNSSVVLGSDVDWRNGLTFMEQGQPYTLALEKINKKYENRSSKSLNKLRGSLGNSTDELQQTNINKIKEPIVEKLNDLAEQQKYQHAMQNKIQMLPEYKCGKNKYDNGKEAWLNNFIPNMIGAGLSMKQYYDAKDQPLHSPNIYAENQYEQRALNTLAGLHINGYPILQQLRDAETRQNYALNNSGGLSGAQKYLGRIANANNLYSNIANMWSNLQEKNLGYKSQYAQAAINAGNAAAQRKQQANQYRDDMYAKAHGARQQQMQMGMRNFMDYLNQYSANEFKRRQFNKMIGLYEADADNKKNNTAANVFIPQASKNPIKGIGLTAGDYKLNVPSINLAPISKIRRGGLDLEDMADYYNQLEESLRMGSKTTRKSK